MKLLILTQKVDRNDSNLGFFHQWLLRLAVKVDKLTVICLEKGEYDLPNNVRVLSLCKENQVSRWQYLINFYSYIFKYRHEYDGVFVHMNPEYIVLGGLFWRVWHKKILLWYTHKSVNLKLRIAEKFADKIFTVSKESFRLPSDKLEIVGHGIDVQNFEGAAPILSPATHLSLLTVGRVTPDKDVGTLIRAVYVLKKLLPAVSCALDIVGDPVVVSDFPYREKMLSLIQELAGQEASLVQIAGYPYDRIPAIYHSHHIFVQGKPTGSVDKVVLEALAAGLPVVVANGGAYADAVKDKIVYSFPAGDYQELAKTIEKIWKAGIIIPNEKAIEFVRENHNIDTLITKIIGYFKSL